MKHGHQSEESIRIVDHRPHTAGRLPSSRGMPVDTRRSGGRDRA
jgi:hypothetical protein